MKCPVCHSKNLTEVNEVFVCDSCDYILTADDKPVTLKFLYNKSKRELEREAYRESMEEIQKRQSRKPYFRLRYFEL